MSDEKEIPTEVRTGLLYLLIATQCAAAAVSIVIVLALTIPLLIQLKNGSFYSTDSQRRGREPRYSTYNLYLVYLALLDLVFLLPNIPALWMNANGKYHPRFYSADLMSGFPPNYKTPPVALIVNVPYGLANLWINAAVAYQVMSLLRASKNAKRVAQPTVMRVNRQGGGLMLGSMIIGILSYYQCTVRWANDTAFAAVVDLFVFVPFVYVFGVSILVKWRGYMPTVNGSTPWDRAVRGLAIYFFRITMVFVVVWLPSVVLVGIVFRKAEQGVIEVDGVRIYNVGIREQLYGLTAFFLMSIQPILTFCMILTKPDVKKYIKDLVTLAYLTQRFDNCFKVKGEAPTELADLETGNERPHRRNSVSILGYSFSEIDDVADHDDSEQNADTSMVDETNNTDVDTAANIRTDTDNDATNNNESIKAKATGNDMTDKTVSDTQSLFSTQLDLELGDGMNEEEEDTVEQGESSDEGETPHYGTRGRRAVHRRIGPDGDIIVAISKL